MNYGFELMSEIIPLCIVAVLGIDMIGNCETRDARS